MGPLDPNQGPFWALSILNLTSNGFREKSVLLAIKTKAARKGLEVAFFVQKKIMKRETKWLFLHPEPHLSNLCQLKSFFNGDFTKYSPMSRTTPMYVILWTKKFLVCYKKKLRGASKMAFLFHKKTWQEAGLPDAMFPWTNCEICNCWFCPTCLTLDGVAQHELACQKQ